ncbi:MAG TPA: hypothetical protein VJL32_01695 [Candidatus Paceibacterota bacterium]
MVVSALGGWFVAYLLPVLLMLAAVFLFSRRPGTTFRMLAVHSALCLSIILSQYLLYLAHRPFPFDFPFPSILFFTATMVIVPAILGRFGFFYALSAFIQELALTSIAYYLFGPFNFWLVVLLVVPIYATSHLLEPKYWRIKIPTTLVWGTVSLALFAAYGDILLNTSLHAILGSFFIYGGIMYPRSDFAIQRVQNPSRNETSP